MFAIVSDIHANLEALTAVISHIKKQDDIEDILCLGDIIGYGPNPRESLRVARDFFRFSLIGNHEEAVLYLAEDFNERARQAVEWTRAALNDKDLDREERHLYWNYLDAVSKLDKVQRGDFLFVHGSPRVPTKEYILPRDVHDSAKLEAVFAMVPRVMFCGHSHVPGVYTPDREYRHPTQLENNTWHFADAEKCIVNVGSVGQPRDQDTRACYVTFDDDKVVFHRVTYDYMATVKKILESGGLPEYLAERLKEGR